MLHVGALSAFGVSWPDAAMASIPSASPRPASFGRAKRCLLLFLTGGPPQHDTFDMKPHAPDRIRIGEIEGGAVGRDDFAERRQRALEIPAELAVSASEKDSQSKNSAERSGGARRSLSLTIGSPSSGQRRPSAGSLQKMVRSCSGA